MKRPTSTQTLQVLHLAERQLRRVIDAWTDVALVADTPDTPRIEQVKTEGKPVDLLYVGIRTHNGSRKTFEHSDPTGDAAIVAGETAAQRWLGDLEEMLGGLARLDDRIVSLVGEPVERCPGCDLAILAKDRTETSGGRRWHGSCYTKHRRAARGV